MKFASFEFYFVIYIIYIIHTYISRISCLYVVLYLRKVLRHDLHSIKYHAFNFSFISVNFMHFKFKGNLEEKDSMLYAN